MGIVSLPPCATGPAGTANQAACSVQRWSRCSSSGSVLLPLDGLLPDPRGNLHGLVSRHHCAVLRSQWGHRVNVDLMR